MRLEVWTRPGHANYGRVVNAKSLSVVNASGTKKLGTAGFPVIGLPRSFDRLDEIISRDPAAPATDVKTIGRLYRDGSDIPVDEFFIDQLFDDLTSPLINLTSKGNLRRIAGLGTVEAWDWMGAQTEQSQNPDWLWGGPDLMPKLELGELGSIREEYELFNDQTPGTTFTITVDGQTTTALNWDASEAAIEGSPLGTPFGLEGLSNVNDVTVSGSGTAADPWTIVFFDPPNPTSVTVTDSGGLSSTLTQTVAGMLDPAPFTKSQSIDASTTPTIHGCYDDPPTEVDTTIVNAPSEYSIKVNATCRYAGDQIVLTGIKPGAVYQWAGPPIRPTVTGDYTIVVRDQNENEIKRTSPRDNNMTAGTWTQLFINDIEIPEGTTAVILRAAVTDANPANIAAFNVDWQGSSFTEGQQVTTVGDMIESIHTDLTVTHVPDGLIFWEDEANPGTPYLLLDFDATVDSAGNAWDRNDLSYRIQRGETLEQALDGLVAKHRYEWDIACDPADPDSGIYYLSIWNPGGRGIHKENDDHPAIHLGQGVTAGPVAKRHLGANRWMVEGADNIISRAESAASIGAIGRVGAYLGDRNLRDAATVAETANRQVLISLLEGLSIEVNTTTEGSSVPFRDFDVGDTIMVTIPGLVSRSAHRVAAITWRLSADGVPSFAVQFSSEQFGGPSGGSAVGGGGGPGVSMREFAGTAEGVRRLLSAYKGLDDPRDDVAAIGGGSGGGAPTYVFATNQSSQYSQNRADMILIDGTDMTDAVMSIINGIDTEVGWARLLFCEGYYTFRPGELVIPGLFKVEGMGWGATQFDLFGTSTGTVMTLSGSLIQLESVEIFGTTGTALQVDAAVVSIRDLYITGGAGYSIEVTDSHVWIDTVWMTGAGGIHVLDTGDVHLSEIHMVGGDAGSANGSAVFVENSSYVTGQGIYGTGAGDFGGADSALLHFSDATRCNFTNCNFLGGSAAYAVLFDTAESCRVSDSYFQGSGAIRSVVWEASLDCYINDTHISEIWVDDAGDAGLLVNDSTDGGLIDCHLDYGMNNDNDRDAVQITGTTNGFQIRDIVARGRRGGSQLWRNTINVISGSCNVIVGNDLIGSYGTEPIVDNGTDTQLTYPNDIQYGDNFTVCDGSSS